jgi:nucleoside-diphosphate-sugar epimerase
VVEETKVFILGRLFAPQSEGDMIQNRVLITGAAGFIGSRVAVMLAEQGIPIVAIDNFDSYYDIQLKFARWNGLARFDHVAREELDLEDESSLDVIFKRFSIQAVINFAGMAGVRNSIRFPRKYFQVNSTAFAGLLEVMRKHSVRHIIQASTSSLYAGATLPFDESSDVRHPISPYAASKLSAEALGFTYSKLHGFDVTVLRFFTVYGPAGRPDMGIFRFIEWSLMKQSIQLFGDGTQTRDYTYVDDIAQGVIRALETRLPGFEIINLGSGRGGKTLMEIIQMIGAMTHYKPEIEFLPTAQGDMVHTMAKIEKARELLGWTPTFTLEEGLRQTVQWHRDNLYRS